MKFLNREIAQEEQKEEELAKLAAQIAEQVIEDREIALITRTEAWYRRFMERLGISMDLVRPQKVVIEIEPLTMLPVVTIVCQPDIDIERLLSTERFTPPPVTEYLGLKSVVGIKSDIEGDLKGDVESDVESDVEDSIEKIDKENNNANGH